MPLTPTEVTSNVNSTSTSTSNTGPQEWLLYGLFPQQLQGSGHSLHHGTAAPAAAATVLQVLPVEPTEEVLLLQSFWVN
jgi:hypothetical protein